MHEFLISNYATEATQDRVIWWRGYSFQVDEGSIKLYQLLSSVATLRLKPWIALYKSSGTYGHIPQELLFSHQITATGRGVPVNIPSPISLEVGQHYILAQGSTDNIHGTFNNQLIIDFWDQVAMVAAEPWINYWYPVNTDQDPEECLLWSFTGTPTSILGVAAEHDSGRAPGRPDIGFAGTGFDGKLFEMWAKVGGAWKDVVDVSGKVGTWKEATDFIPKVGGTWKE